MTEAEKAVSAAVHKSLNFGKAAKVRSRNGGGLSLGEKAPWVRS